MKMLSAYGVVLDFESKTAHVMFSDHKTITDDPHDMLQRAGRFYKREARAGEGCRAWVSAVEAAEREDRVFYLFASLQSNLEGWKVHMPRFVESKGSHFSGRLNRPFERMIEAAAACTGRTEEDMAWLHSQCISEGMYTEAEFVEYLSRTGTLAIRNVGISGGSRLREARRTGLIERIKEWLIAMFEAIAAQCSALLTAKGPSF